MNNKIQAFGSICALSNEFGIKSCISKFIHQDVREKILSHTESMFETMIYKSLQHVPINDNTRLTFLVQKAVHKEFQYMKLIISTFLELLDKYFIYGDKIILYDECIMKILCIGRVRPKIEIMKGYLCRIGILISILDLLEIDDSSLMNMTDWTKTLHEVYDSIQDSEDISSLHNNNIIVVHMSQIKRYILINNIKYFGMRMLQFHKSQNDKFNLMRKVKSDVISSFYTTLYNDRFKSEL